MKGNVLGKSRGRDVATKMILNNVLCSHLKKAVLNMYSQ